MNFKCDKCSYTTSYRQSVRRHKLLVHCDLKPFSCAFSGCAFRSKSKYDIKVHKRVHETRVELRKPYACTFDNCDYRASWKSSLNNHRRTKHSPGRTRDVQCPLCPARFHSGQELNFHIHRHVKEKIFKCTQCQFVTHNPSSLPRHVRTLHGKSVRFDCSVKGCTYTTAYKFALNSHSKIHDPDPVIRRPFPCSFPNCSYRGSAAANLKKHILVHHSPSRSKQLSCPLCTQRIYNEVHLRSHIQVRHTNEKYSCKICNFATRDSFNFRRHCYRVHGHGEAPQKRFICEFCDYRTKQRFHLELHKRTTHSEIREFHCSSPGCSFSTNYPHSFERHLLTHEEDPRRQFPFACTIQGCDYRTRTTAGIRKHERCHNASKIQLKCKMCQMGRFPDQRSLQFHEYLNHSKSYQCSLCNYNGISKRAIVLHLRTRHNHKTRHQVSVKPASGPQGRRNNTEVIRGGQVSNGRPGCLLHNSKSTGKRLEDSVCHRVPVVLLQRINVKIV